MTETKPDYCPFCGGGDEAITVNVRPGVRGGVWKSHCECENCGARGPIDTSVGTEDDAKEKAVHGWNERFDNRAVKAHPARMDALEEILNYEGGAPNALEDEYVMERAEAALKLAKGEK